MSGRPVWIVAAVLGAAFICGSGLIGLASGAAACVPATRSLSPWAGTAVAGYDGEQLANATSIVSVGAGRRIPIFGQVIAVATAVQESSLRNLTKSVDHDSLGLFQQRPSRGWGTPQQLVDPVYAANAFYDRLLSVPGWERLPLTEAAQAVQASRYPDAYARWESDAAAIVAVITGVYGDCHAGDGMAAAAEALPADFTLPAHAPPAVAAAIGWALEQLGTPYAFGGDCTDAHSADPARQCDCSSLIQQAYRAGGVTLPRVTEDQQHVGAAVADLTDALPGDLVFIPGANGTPTDPGHVGLYIGHRLIVQAPHTGDVVKLTAVGAWADRVAKIRRPLR